MEALLAEVCVSGSIDRTTLICDQREADYGEVVFLESSVLVTVPSDDFVTVFSFEVTVPSLLTDVLFSLETCRSQPTSRTDNPKTDKAMLTIITCFFIEALYPMRKILSMG